MPRALATALLVVAATPIAVVGAQDAPEPVDTRVGQASDALPGLERVALPRAVPWTGAVSASAGYGFTESVLAAGDDSHHRLAGRLALGIQPVEFFALGLQLDGRYDTHSGGGASDDGLVGDPRLLLRGMTDLGGASIGGQATVWIPGQDAPSIVFGALSVDLEAMVDIGLSPDFHLGINAGFRLDQSSESIDMPDRLSDADRLALGLSDSNAVLLGLGGGYRMDKMELYGEWTWDFLIGSDAPSASKSPMRIGAGARFWMGETDAIQLDGGLEALVLGRPDPADIGPMQPLVPVEPLFRIHVGLTFRFPDPVQPGGPGGPDDDVASDATGTVAGRIVDSDGQPVPGAEVTVSAGGETFGPTTSGADGSWQVADVPVGTASVSVTAEDYRDGTSTVTVEEGATAQAEVALERDLPSGQIRGVVQSFGGQPIQATIRVNPLGEEATADDSGAFEIDVAPGEYEVVITADGYEEQTRSIRVERQGVTILNVDLRRQ